MFSAGAVKLRSGDPTWRDLTASPTITKPSRSPTGSAGTPTSCRCRMQKFSTLGTFFFELVVPFLALGPAPARLGGFLLLLFFQGLIFATGNYGFFNILTMVLLVPLLDDRQLAFLGERLPAAAPTGEELPRSLVSVIFAAVSRSEPLPACSGFSTGRPCSAGCLQRSLPA